ncbi:MAG: hypothetical protein AAF497_10920, partial [Planctomycetota bacterium]
VINHQKRPTALLFPVSLCLTFILIAGCDDGPAVAPVTGTVTRDGKPVVGVMIEFQPETGAPSYAFTGPDGSYEMQYQVDRKGALLGKHRISVTTPNEMTDPETGDTIRVRETIPRAYNEETTLEYTVEKGRNDFDIEIKGERSK